MNINERLTEPRDLLYAAQLDAKPIDMEWDSDGLIEDRWGFHEVLDVELGDWTVPVVVNGHNSVLAARDRNGVIVDLEGSGMHGMDRDDYLEEHTNDDGDTVEGSFTEAQLDELASLAEEQAHEAEGPMMNYWYPLPAVEDDPVAAALALDGLPLCVVEVDGAWGVALTGGGMDLSWEIAEAYCRVGSLPPVHFADLPRMAGIENRSSTPYVLGAMLRALEVAAARALSSAERLRDTYGGVDWVKVDPA